MTEKQEPFERRIRQEIGPKTRFPELKVQGKKVGTAVSLAQFMHRGKIK